MRLSTRNDDAGEELLNMMCRHYRCQSETSLPTVNSVKIIKSAKDDRFDVDIQWLIYFSTQQGHTCEQLDTFLHLLRPASIGRQPLTPRLPSRRCSHRCR
jgi:hypothetical protein